MGTKFKFISLTEHFTRVPLSSVLMLGIDIKDIYSNGGKQTSWGESVARVGG